jgi:hypothetical protein
VRKLNGTIDVTYAPTPSVSVSKMNVVGPTSSRNRSSRIASTMLPLLSHWMPFSTPDTAERTNNEVSTRITRTASTSVWSTPHRKFRPLLICRAPSPSDAALPNSVARTASVSIDLPTGPSTRSPINGRNAELIRFGWPLRKVKYASASPTTA